MNFLWYWEWPFGIPLLSEVVLLLGCFQCHVALLLKVTQYAILLLIDFYHFCLYSHLWNVNYHIFYGDILWLFYRSDFKLICFVIHCLYLWVMRSIVQYTFLFQVILYCRVRFYLFAFIFKEGRTLFWYSVHGFISLYILIFKLLFISSTQIFAGVNSSVLNLPIPIIDMFS